MDGDEPEKEMMIVVNRGSGVDYEEEIGSSFIDEDIRKAFPGRTWAPIRDHLIEDPFDTDDGETWPCSDEEEDSDEEEEFDEEGESDNRFDIKDEKNRWSIEVDVYKDVDEYVWSNNSNP
jgi:hypothetical protein